MPPGTPFNAFTLPYRIRVDDFTQLSPQEPQPALHLLTHTHTDHLNGLASKSFGSVVYCSRDAKEMLLRHEVFMERELYQMQFKAEKTRTYSHLKIPPITQPDGLQCYIGSRDLLKPLPLNTPTTIELQDDEEVTLTLIDANHCPGAVMYLIEGRKGAILHTGDLRAEPWFLDSISHNTFLQPYLAPLSSNSKSFINRTLDAIYLDTACAFSTLFIPTKEQATTGLVELIKLFPPDTYFFINSWTWGYEDVLKSISRTFQCKIHVDRYKYSIYQHVSDPYLRSLVTTDASATRFHACERFHRCDDVAVANDPKSSDTTVLSRAGKRVIYVNPVNMGVESWELYLNDTKRCLRTSEPVNTLLVPLSRHSTLPELQAFVRLFRPHRVIPNTLDPRLHGFDWMCIDRMFEACLTPLAGLPSSLIPPTPADGSNLDILQVQVDEEGDTAVKNIVGPSDLALSWADKGRLRNKLEIMVGYLDPERKSFLDKLLRCRPDSPPAILSTSKIQLPLIEEYSRAAFDRDSEDSDDDDAEENNWRTAHILFGSPSSAEGQQLKWPFLSPGSQNGHDDDDELPVAPQNQAVLQPVHATPPWSPVRQNDNHLMQGRMLRTSRKRARDTEDRPSTPRFRKRSALEGHALASPIHLPTNSARSADRVISRRSVFSQHGNTTPPSRHKAPDNPLLKSTRHQIMAATVHHSSTVQMRSDVLQSCTAHDENVYVPEPSDRQSPGHLDQNSPNRVVPLSVSPDNHTRVDLGVAEVQANQHSTVILRRKQMVERTIKSLELAERLARANPARVVPTYHEKRARLLKQCTRSEVKVQYLEALGRSKVQNVIPDPHFDLSTFKTVESSQIGINWERSKALEEHVRAELARGEWPIFPSLACTDSQPD